MFDEGILFHFFPVKEISSTFNLSNQTNRIQAGHNCWCNCWCFHLHILIGMTLTKKRWFPLNRSVFRNCRTIYQHLRGVCALRKERLRRRKVSLVFSLCVAEILGYGPGEVQYVILSKALIPFHIFWVLYDVCLNPHHLSNAPIYQRVCCFLPAPLGIFLCSEDA